MKNRGFTLIELLGVVIILALIMILVFPSIINSIKKSSKTKDDLTLELIYSASNSYVKKHANDFMKTNGNKYIIELSDLIDEGHLVSPIELSDSEDITNEKCVQVSYSNTNGFEYELKDSCVKKTICTAVTTDTKTTGNVPSGNYTAGDEYVCEVKEGTTYTFFVLSINEDDTVNLIMDSNINELGQAVKSNEITNKGTVAAITFDDYNYSDLEGDPPNYKGPVTALNYLHNITKNWTNIPNININYNDEGHADISDELEKGIGYKSINTVGIKTTITRNNGNVTATYYNLKSRMPTLKEVLDVGCKCRKDGSGSVNGFTDRTDCPSWNRDENEGCPLWIYNYLRETGVDGLAGYYLLASDQTRSSGSYKYILDIYASGDIGNNWYKTSTTNGVRPVITLPKSELN